MNVCEAESKLCLLSVCAACAAGVHAAQVPAGLHLSASRQDIPGPYLHRHSDRLLHHHVVHQEHRCHVHHLPAHGIYTSHAL